MKLYKRGITVLGAGAPPAQPAGQVSTRTWTLFGLAVGGLTVAALVTSFGSDKSRRKKR